MTLSTNRIIGSDAENTNLVRVGDTLTATTSWLNTGNIDLDIENVIALENAAANAKLASWDFTSRNLSGGEFNVAGGFNSSDQNTTLTAGIEITGQAGQLVDLTQQILQVKADGISDIFTNSQATGQGTKNLITYQGD